MAEALLAQYDGLVCDLDGVVYAGPSAIPHAVDSLSAATASGRRVVYATNNASRPPSQVAAHLRNLGLQLVDADVINSSMAAAQVLGDLLPAGAAVLAVGGEGVFLALAEAGFTPAVPGRDSPAEVRAVVQGYGPQVMACDLAEAAYAIQGGARWVATNTDATLPTDRGVAPGNGSLVRAVRAAVDVDPVVAGKPMPVMYDMASTRMNVETACVLAVGDRLETDIEGARRGSYDSVLVLTGVHGLADAAAAPSLQRPTYVVRDLRDLAQPYVVADSAPASGPVALDEARACLVDLWQRVDSGAMSVDEARDTMSAIERRLA